MNALYATLDGLRPTALSVLRIVAALLFLEHGLSKVFGFPVAGPPLNGLLIVAAFLETVGAVLLLVGRLHEVRSRSSCPARWRSPISWRMSRGRSIPLRTAGKSAILFCFVFLYFVFAGGGPVSLDRLVLKQR